MGIMMEIPLGRNLVLTMAHYLDHLWVMTREMTTVYLMVQRKEKMMAYQ